MVIDMIDLIKKREKQAAYFEANTITQEEYIEIIDRAIAAESKLDDMFSIWNDVDEFTRPKTALGCKVSDKVLELLKSGEIAESKLAEMSEQIDHLTSIVTAIDGDHDGYKKALKIAVLRASQEREFRKRLAEGYGEQDAELRLLRAKLAEIEKQGPVAVMSAKGSVMTKAQCNDNEAFEICCRVQTPLYASPVQQSQEKNEWREAVITSFQSINKQFKDDPYDDIQALVDYWYCCQQSPSFLPKDAVIGHDFKDGFLTNCIVISGSRLSSFNDVGACKLNGFAIMPVEEYSRITGIKLPEGLMEKIKTFEETQIEDYVYGEESVFTQDFHIDVRKFHGYNENPHGALFRRVGYTAELLSEKPAAAPDDKVFLIDPRYENGEYYLLGSDINELLSAAASPAVAISKMETTSTAVVVPDLKACIDEISEVNDRVEYVGKRGRITLLTKRALSMLSTPTPPSEEPNYKSKLIALMNGLKFKNEFAAVDEMSEEDFYTAGVLIADKAVEQPDSAAPNEPRYLVRVKNRHPEHLDREVFFVSKNKPHDFDESDYRNAILFTSGATKPQRVTEQDARELMTSSLKYLTVEHWLDPEGRTLLAKLNEHRDPDFKRQRDLLLIHAQTVVDEYYNTPSYEQIHPLYLKNLEAAIAQCEGGKQ